MTLLGLSDRDDRETSGHPSQRPSRKPVETQMPMRHVRDKTVHFFICAASLLVTATLAAETFTLHTFRKIQLTDKFWTEAPTYGDLNKDGSQDIIVGPYWFEGPSFRNRHEYSPAVQSF